MMVYDYHKSSWSISLLLGRMVGSPLASVSESMRHYGMEGDDSNIRVIGSYVVSSSLMGSWTSQGMAASAQHFLFMSSAAHALGSKEVTSSLFLTHKRYIRRRDGRLLTSRRNVLEDLYVLDSFLPTLQAEFWSDLQRALELAVESVHTDGDRMRRLRWLHAHRWTALARRFLRENVSLLRWLWKGRQFRMFKV